MQLAANVICVERGHDKNVVYSVKSVRQIFKLEKYLCANFRVTVCH